MIESECTRYCIAGWQGKLITDGVISDFSGEIIIDGQGIPSELVCAIFVSIAGFERGNQYLVKGFFL